MKSIKTVALTASTKDQARESHAREITGRQIRHKILDEKFPDYQKLLDNAEAVPPSSFTLPDLSTLWTAPSVSGEKRGCERLDDDEAEDTTSSGIVQNTVPPGGQESVYTAPPSPTTLETAATILQAEAMAAFLEAPFLPDAYQMRVDDITALLVLLLEDLLRSAALNLICKLYSPENAAYAWSQ